MGAVSTVNLEHTAMAKKFTSSIRTETHTRIKPFKYRSHEADKDTVWDKSYKAERIDTVEATIELTVDVDKLLQVLGARAVCSKGGKAIEASGMIKARVVTRKVVDSTEKKAPICWLTPDKYEIVDL